MVQQLIKQTNSLLVDGSTGESCQLGNNVNILIISEYKEHTGLEQRIKQNSK